MKVPELDELIAAHAHALIASDDRAAEAMVTQAGLANWRALVAAISARRPLERYELLARAKIGMQFMAKTRFSGAGGALTLLIRWKQADGRWMIAEAEDISDKRSPWSDLQHYRRERGGATNA
jgi:hypothetical protein